MKKAKDLHALLQISPLSPKQAVNRAASLFLFAAAPVGGHDKLSERAEGVVLSPPFRTQKVEVAVGYLARAEILGYAERAPFVMIDGVKRTLEFVASAKRRGTLIFHFLSPPPRSARQVHFTPHTRKVKRHAARLAAPRAPATVRRKKKIPEMYIRGSVSSSYRGQSFLNTSATERNQSFTAVPRGLYKGLTSTTLPVLVML